mmetsp:Transcript_20714/g.34134  ORF Transcript_20714/g.34134 Transcript_20714/m.34134 type:complete len:84 (+) Transcript_20714:146-397(+)
MRQAFLSSCWWVDSSPLCPASSPLHSSPLWPALPSVCVCVYALVVLMNTAQNSSLGLDEIKAFDGSINPSIHGHSIPQLARMA